MATIIWSSILTDHKENSSIGLAYGLGTTRKMKKKAGKEKHGRKPLWKTWIRWDHRGKIPAQIEETCSRAAPYNCEEL